MNTITPMDSANQEVWIGVDVGTTGVRAIAYTEDGTNVCSSEAFYPLLTPKESSESPRPHKSTKQARRTGIQSSTK